MREDARAAESLARERTSSSLAGTGVVVGETFAEASWLEDGDSISEIEQMLVSADKD